METWKHGNMVRNVVYFVNYKIGEKDRERLDRKILEIVEPYRPCEIRHINHSAFPVTANIERPLSHTAKLLEKYAAARLVITTNLHCALPCLGMGVPVVLAIPEYDHTRFKGLASFPNTVGQNENDEFAENIERDERGFVRNPTRHLRQVNMLGRLCRAFMKTDSVTVHHKATDESGDFDEESEWWMLHPAVRKFRDFFCKKVMRQGKRELRICKLLYLERK